MIPDPDYECAACGARMPSTEPLWRCPRCNGPMMLTPGAGLRRDQIRADIASLWRYGAAIRVSGPTVSLGEGLTPLMPGEIAGCPVQFKLEFLMPTGSFQGRGTPVTINHLLDRRVPGSPDDSAGTSGGAPPPHP